MGRGLAALGKGMVPSLLFGVVGIRTALFLLPAETILDKEGRVFIGLAIFLTAGSLATTTTSESWSGDLLFGEEGEGGGGLHEAHGAEECRVICLHVTANQSSNKRDSVSSHSANMDNNDSYILKP